MTYHFVVYFMEMNFADFVHHLLAFEGDEAEPAVAVRLFVEHKHCILNLVGRKEQFKYLNITWGHTLLTLAGILIFLQGQLAAYLIHSCTILIMFSLPSKINKISKREERLKKRDFARELCNQSKAKNES